MNSLFMEQNVCEICGFDLWYNGVVLHNNSFASVLTMKFQWPGSKVGDGVNVIKWNEFQFSLYLPVGEYTEILCLQPQIFVH